ncbi:cupin domain-containing protein [Pseudomonas sp. R2.Fl]|nr:cupin domain-containing protein [Pseudomonas sp. R2.Fl]
MNALPNRSGAPLNTPYHFLGNLLTFRAAAADTDGRFSIVETVTAPGAGAPPHTQQDEEAFLVLDGAYDFLLGDTWMNCGPGEFVFVRPGTPHAFRNPTGRPSKMLVINLPGGQHENFFLAVSDRLPPGTTEIPPMTPPDLPRIGAAAARHGITFLDPK